MAGVLAQAVLPALGLAQTRAEGPSGPRDRLTLVESVHLALDHHPAVGAASARREGASGVLSQARASLFPALATEGSLTRHQEPMLVAPLHGFDPTMAPTFDQNLVRGNLTLSYTLFDGGARGARIQRAEAGLDLAVELVSAHRGSVTLLDPATDDAIILVTRSLIGPDQLPGWRHRMPRGAVTTMRQGEVYYVPDVQVRSERMPIEDILDQMAVRSYVNVPLTVQGELIGSLNLSSQQRDAFGHGSGSTLREVADRLALAIYNARLFAEVESSHQRLQLLSRRLVEVQEDERSIIARELHDEIGQTLTGLKITLEAARQPAGDESASLARALHLVDELMARTRQMSIALRPPMLDDLGLLHTLLWHLTRYTEQTGIDVDFEHRSLERRYPPELEMAGYRIVQEALTNIARHARVDRARVRLWSGDGALNIQVEDAGDGFDYTAVLRAGQSTGLLGMAERAHLLGGQFTVETAPGLGTCITVTFPLPNGAAS
jgi:signal transduction histidine kinase